MQIQQNDYSVANWTGNCFNLKLEHFKCIDLIKKSHYDHVFDKLWLYKQS